MARFEYSVIGTLPSGCAHQSGHISRAQAARLLKKSIGRVCPLVFARGARRYTLDQRTHVSLRGTTYTSVDLVISVTS